MGVDCFDVFPRSVADLEVDFWVEGKLIQKLIRISKKKKSNLLNYIKNLIEGGFPT